MIKEKLNPIIGLFFGILAVSTASIFIRFAQDGAGKPAGQCHKIHAGGEIGRASCRERV